MYKVLVTGSEGQLGSEIKERSKKISDINFLFADQPQFSFENLQDIDSKLNFYAPDLIINCAAYTAVDQAETEIELVDLINNKAVGYIANWVSKNKKKLIHISTDYVFDGTKNYPLNEEMTPTPINNYGKSKLNGELAILNANTDAIIIRTSWLYSAYGKNFVKSMIYLMQQRKEISVVNDQIGSPTYAGDLANFILKLINGDKWHNGIFHFSNIGESTWYEFAIAIKNLTKLDCYIHPVSSDNFPTKAKRPKYSLLDKTKIKNVYKLEISHWEESLKHMISNLSFEENY